jgi:hypothetical protein
MYFLRGKWHLKRRDYERAIHDFERARARIRRHTSRTLFMVSLVSLSHGYNRNASKYPLCQISGWNFDDLGIMIQKYLCETLYAAGRTKEASESLLKMANTLDEEVYVSAHITMWVSGKLYATSSSRHLFDISRRFRATMSLRSCKQS